MPPRTDEGAPRLLSAVQQHLRAEALRDVEATMATITPDCRYEFPWQDLVIQGPDVLRRYYGLLFSSRPGPSLPPVVRRYWVSGHDTICIELGIRYHASDGTTLESLIMTVFDVVEDRVAREIIYATEHQERISEWRRSEAVGNQAHTRGVCPGGTLIDRRLRR